MVAEILNKNNERTGEIKLPAKFFGVKWNPDLVHQALLAQMANRRLPWAHAKGRGEVRGGGRKPWRQKGTGRARHGSIRSPLWSGGGVTFGPSKEKIYSQKINKVMKRLAVFSTLSKKFSEGEVAFLDDFKMADLKTKNLNKILESIFGKNASVLLVSTLDNKEINKVAKNIPKVDSIGATSLNVHDLLSHKNILLEKSAIEEIEKHYSKK